MFDLGWSELLLVGIVALIVIGPKDLPEMFRTLGRFTAKARGMAREFSRAMESAADEAGVKDMAKDIRNAANLPRTGLDTVKDAARKFESWDPMKTTKPAAPVVAVGPKAAEPAAPADAPPSGAALPEAKPMGPATAALAEARAAKQAAARAAAAPEPTKGDA
jgi:sec-independent protein translocase protein TatB